MLDPEVDPRTCCGTLGPRLRATFGPTVAGLLGGALAGLLALPALGPLCRNVEATYASFPSLEQPWITVYPSLPGWLTVAAGLVGFAAVVSTGAATVWLVRPRDAWADLSAGLTSALAATLAAFVTCAGWPVILAMVVVPSIADLTSLGDAVRPDEVAHPSQRLVDRYPDLEQIPPDERGPKLMTRIVAGQVTGSAGAIGVGVLMTLLTAGALALCGTLAAGFLGRRGDSLTQGALPYLELTLPLTATGTLTASAMLSPVWNLLLGSNPFEIGLLSLIGLAAFSAFMVLGVTQRWSWWLRLCLALTCVLALTQMRQSSLAWPLPLIAAALTAFLTVKRWVVRPAAQLG